jgi:hypothetical protein
VQATAATKPFNVASSSGSSVFDIDTTGKTTLINGSTTAVTIPTLYTGFTLGSVPYIGTSGVLSQNNANLFWDNTNEALGIATSTFTNFSSLNPAKVIIDSTATTSQEGLNVISAVNDFFETNVINKSSGANAQACQTATNNLGTLTTGFVSICANSSTFNNPTAYNTGGAGDTSIMGYSSGDFILANATATRSMLFLTGGSATSTFTRFSLSGTGNALFQGGATSSTAFVIKNPSANPVFTINTTPPGLTDFLFQVATSSNDYFFGVKGNGHLSASSTAPTLSSCGTSPSIRGTDTAGEVTVGSVSANGCTITFANAWTNSPSCIIMSQTGSITNTFSYTVSTTAIVVTETGLTGAKMDYHCIGIGE